MCRFVLSCLLLLSFAVGPTRTASSQADAAWQQVSGSLPSGPINALVSDAYGTVVATTFAGIYSYDPSSGWRLSDAPDVQPYALSVSPGGVFYASARSALLRSDDGRTWQSLWVPGDLYQPVAALDSGRIYAYIQDSSVCPQRDYFWPWHRSDDDGATWSCATDDRDSPLARARDVIVTERGTLLVTSPEGLFRGTDGGASWDYGSFDGGSRFNRGFFELMPGRGVIGATNPYAPTREPEDYVSLDDGRTWVQTGPDGRANAYARESATLFAGLWKGTRCTGPLVIGAGGITGDGECISFSGGVERSTDGGATWTQTSLADQGVEGIVARGTTVFAGGYTGLFVSSDAGASWRSEPLPNQVVSTLAADEGGALYAATFPRRLHRSSDGGASWQPVDVPAYDADLADGGPSSFRFWTPTFTDASVFSDGTLYVVDDNLLRSSDGGQTWETRVLGFILNDLIEGEGGALLASGSEGPRRSLDRGDSWQRIGQPGIDARQIVRAPGGTLYAASSGSSIGSRVYVLAPGAAEWTTVDVGGYYLGDIMVSASGRLFATAEPIEPSVVVETVQVDAPVLGSRWMSAEQLPPASSESALLHFSDDLASWEPVAGVDEAARLAIAPSGTLYAGAFVSSDDGVTWRKSEGLKGEAHAFAFGPDGSAYAGTQGGGVFRSGNTAVTQSPSASVSGFRLHAPRPHPVAQGAAVRIGFDLPNPGHVRAVAYDLLGREYAPLADGTYASGAHELIWQTGSAPSGAYLVRLSSEMGERSVLVVVAR